VKHSSRKAEADRILDRLDEQAEKTLSTPKAAEGDADWTERLGRRLGRIFGVVLALYLLWHLVTTYLLQP
jgi:tetrahydromethanopterin S-methyltransferase subunit G